jgi:hypothetical protein
MTDVFHASGAGRTAIPALSTGADDMLRVGETARGVVEEIASMLQGVEDTSIPVPRSEWTVGDHGAHLAYTNIGFGMFAMGLEYPYGDGTRAGLAEANESFLYGFDERGGPELAQHLRVGVKNFLAQVAVQPPDKECFSPLGRMPLSTLTSYFLIHNLMHGSAISAGLNRPFPARPEHMPMVWPLLVHAFPTFVTESSMRGLLGCVHVHVKGVLDAVFEMDGSRLVLLDAPTGSVDCYVEAEPVHYFLVMMKMLTVEEAVALEQISISGADPALFGRMMDAIDVP